MRIEVSGESGWKYSGYYAKTDGYLNNKPVYSSTMGSVVYDGREWIITSAYDDSSISANTIFEFEDENFEAAIHISCSSKNLIHHQEKTAKLSVFTSV